MSPFPAPLSRLLRSLVLLGLAALVPALAAAPDAPPAYADGRYLVNGCHISTEAYLARFTREFPAERGEILTFMRRNVAGVPVSHTVALVTWAGKWWVRDDTAGVVGLGRPTTETNRKELAAAAERALDRTGPGGRRGRRERPGWLNSGDVELSPARRMREVEAAAGMAPWPSLIFVVRTDRGDVPVLFFRRSEREVGVYEPTFGSCLAETGIGDAAAIVKLAVEGLGRTVEGVSEVAVPAAPRVAMR